MNNTKRLISLILTAILIVSCLGVGVPVFSASPSTKTVEVYAGETYNLEFSEDNCYGIECDIRYDNESLFSSITPWSNNNGRVLKNKVILYGSQPETYAAYLKVTIKADAAVGSRCTVTFYDCIRTDSSDGSGPEGYQKSVTVVVVEKPVPPTSSSSTSSSTTSSVTTTTKPVATTKAPTGKLDFTKLNEQIASAEALNEADYTPESWANFAAALKNAVEARKAKTQAEINAATEALKNAQNALVSVSQDNTQALTDLVKEAKSFLEQDKLSAAYKALMDALTEAEAALVSGNKDQINAAYTKVKTALESYKTALENAQKTQIVEVEKLVPSEPDGPFCNLRLHKLWLILLIISFILNLVFIALILFFFFQKKKKNKA